MLHGDGQTVIFSGLVNEHFKHKTSRALKLSIPLTNGVASKRTLGLGKDTSRRLVRDTGGNALVETVKM